jgi:hypothetical protein
LRRNKQKGDKMGECCVGPGGKEWVGQKGKSVKAVTGRSIRIKFKILQFGVEIGK